MKINATVKIHDTGKPVELLVELRGVSGSLFLVHENSKRDHAIVQGIGELWDGERVTVEITKVQKKEEDAFYSFAEEELKKDLDKTIGEHRHD